VRGERITPVPEVEDDVVAVGVDFTDMISGV
jgi:hypothetical protein